VRSCFSESCAIAGDAESDESLDMLKTREFDQVFTTWRTELNDVHRRYSGAALQVSRLFGACGVRTTGKGASELGAAAAADKTVLRSPKPEN
jgi:hypothetical protein